MQSPTLLATESTVQALAAPTLPEDAEFDTWLLELKRATQLALAQQRHADLGRWCPPVLRASALAEQAD